MSVWYLDLDDEITDAVARLRAARDDKVILVLPPGSRIGTGRINFRLLGREADSRGLTLTLVSDDAQVRALAAAAGLTAYRNVPDAERAVRPTLSAAEGAGKPAVPGEDAASATAGASAETSAAELAPAAEDEVATATDATATVSVVTSSAVSVPGGRRLGGMLRRGKDEPAASRSGYGVTPRTSAAAAAVAGGGSATTTLVGEGARVARRGPGSARKVATWGARGAVLGAVGAGALYVAYLTMPTATVVLAPGASSMMRTISITANPNTETPDAVAGTIPAEWQQYPLAETQSFKATGVKDRVTPATGSVRFTSENTVTPVTITEGTKVWTEGGITFKTTKEARLPQWKDARNTDPPTVEVPIVAIKNGPEGNVGRNEITGLPQAYRTMILSVTNPQATGGGDRVKVRFVTREDVGAAHEQLNAALDAQLTTALQEPPPAGMTIYPDSRDLGAVVYSVADGDLVRQELEQFELGATTTATALSVDEAAAVELAGEHFLRTAQPGTQIDPASIVTLLQRTAVREDSVTYDIDVTADVRRTVDAAKIEDEIRGKPVSEARSILREYGEAILTMWPEFIPTVPDDLGRITLTIGTPAATAEPR